MSLKEMFWNKDKLSSRNRIIAYLFIGFLVVGFFKVESLLEVKEQITEMEEGECYTQILDEDGKGGTFPTEYCLQLKSWCNADYHNIPCKWFERENNVSICQCDMYVIDILQDRVLEEIEW